MVAQVVVNTALVPYGALVSVPESELAANFRVKSVTGTKATACWQAGFECPVICSPDELMEDSDDER